jgi:hypothetical protein
LAANVGLAKFSLVPQSHFREQTAPIQSQDL